jgi:hypothetical protein
MPEKKIDEVIEDLKVLVTDVKTIKNDVAVIKNRLHEINQARIKEEKDKDEISKGWFW